jgi:hypothetical protein
MKPRDDAGSARSGLKRAGMGAAVVLGLAALAAPVSCAVDEPDPGAAPTARVDVEVQFPSTATPSTVASIHLWVVAPNEGSGVTCSSLVGAADDPYDFDVQRRADVASQDTTAHLVADGVGLGAALAYVEAMGFDGIAELAGCVSIDVGAGTNNAVVQLGKAKVSDCTDPATEDGAACDDGDLCTVGETCQNGSCDDGVARDCTHLADGCNAASCDAELGCVTTAVADDTPCEDSLYCTSGDVCLAGECVGAPRDCEAGLGPCEISFGCNEELDFCETEQASNFTPCDDGLFCTESDYCYFGTCDGDTVSCSGLTTSCAVGVCDEIADACVADPYPVGQFCNDGNYCMVSDQCDGAGNCVGTPLVCPNSTTCSPKVCDENLNTCVTMNAMNGTMCDDNLVCTGPDTCNGLGTCVGTVIPMCP